MPKKLNDAKPCKKLMNVYSYLLLAKRAHSLVELSEYFSCSKPTMLRLLQQIEDLETVDFKCEKRGREHFYSIELNKENERKIHTNLDETQVRLMSFCRDIAMPYLSLELRQSLENALLKMNMLVPDKAVDVQTDFLQQSMLGTIDYSSKQQIIKNLLYAIENKRICLIKYLFKPEKEYEMAVTNLVSGKGALYANGYKVKDIGHPKIDHEIFFAVHNITEVIITRFEHDFTAPKNEKAFGIIEGDIFRVKILFDNEIKEYILARKFSDDQSFTETEKGVFLEFSARSEYEILAFILSFGKKAKLIKPLSLVRKVKKELNYMKTLYEK